MSNKIRHIILYVHNMDNGAMFSNLLNYKDKEFYETHKTINFDTLQEAATYEIVYTFVEDIAMDKEHFDFYNYITFQNEEVSNTFIDKCEELNLYETIDAPLFSDKLLTLVTCNDYESTNRMVVIAKQMQ